MVTPKGNSLHKNVSYDVQIVKVGRPIFAQLTLLLSPSNPVLYNAFEYARHPQKCAFPCRHLHAHVIHVPWTHPTQPSKLHLDWFSHFCTAHGRESLYFTMCIKMQLTLE